MIFKPLKRLPSISSNRVKIRYPLRKNPYLKPRENLWDAASVSTPAPPSRNPIRRTNRSPTHPAPTVSIPLPEKRTKPQPPAQNARQQETDGVVETSFTHNLTGFRQPMPPYSPACIGKFTRAVMNRPDRSIASHEDAPLASSPVDFPSVSITDFSQTLARCSISRTNSTRPNKPEMNVPNSSQSYSYFGSV